MASIVAPAALFLAGGGSAYQLAATEAAKPVVSDAAQGRMEVVAAAQKVASPAPVEAQSGMTVVSAQPVSASRYRVVPAVVVPASLPVGVAPERGLQVRTILAARAVSAMFPEIHDIGGVRPDALRWHPNGLALDVMIPNPSSAEGIALGDQIVAFALKNAVRFGLQDCIWRDTYYTPGGSRDGGYGHYDHVHITTKGGGYPTGGEIYLR